MYYFVCICFCVLGFESMIDSAHMPLVLCRSGAVWDKQHGVDVERRRLLERTRELVANGLGAGNLWHTATHAEHARPMLQVMLTLCLTDQADSCT